MNGDVVNYNQGIPYVQSLECNTQDLPPNLVHNFMNPMAEVASSEITTYNQQPINSTMAGVTTFQPELNIPIDQLKSMLSQQLEYYFSRENLANDRFLVALMDDEHYVPISLVANFRQIRKMTTDVKLIVEVIRESPKLQVNDDGTRVRPNDGRTTVILRELAENATLQEIQELFNGVDCPRCVGLESSINNTVYVTFGSEEDAHRAFQYLQEREFQGKKLHPRIKAKHNPNYSTIAPIPPTRPNGFRPPTVAPPQPPAAAATAVFEPIAAFAAQPPPPQVAPQTPQRFIQYPNGTAQTPQYIYPYYAPFHTWGPGQPPIIDITGVFAVNGLSPQQTFKQQNIRYNTRPQKNRYPRNNQQMVDNGGMMNSSIPPQHRMPTQSPQPQHSRVQPVPRGPLLQAAPGTTDTDPSFNVNASVLNNAVLRQNPPDDNGSAPMLIDGNVMVQQVVTLPPPGVPYVPKPGNMTTQPPSGNNGGYQNRDAALSRHRARRRRDDDNNNFNNQQTSHFQNKDVNPSLGPARSNNQAVSVQPQHFDLEASAFPPLPMHDSKSSTNSSSFAAAGTSSANVAETPTAQSSQTDVADTPRPPVTSQWGESRLADVVKGTAKSKNTSNNQSVTSSSTSSAVMPNKDLTRETTDTGVDSAANALDKCAINESSVPEKNETAVVSTVVVEPKTASIVTNEKTAASTTSQSPNAKVAVITTPPLSPSQVPNVKCSMADKSTKTEAELVNGALELNDNPSNCPTTTNAATMTATDATTTTAANTNQNCSVSSSAATVVIVNTTTAGGNKVTNASSNNATTDVTNSSLPTRKSYAQVAQKTGQKGANCDIGKDKPPAAAAALTSTNSNNSSSSTSNATTSKSSISTNSKDNGRFSNSRTSSTSSTNKNDRSSSKTTTNSQPTVRKQRTEQKTNLSEFFNAAQSSNK